MIQLPIFVINLDRSSERYAYMKDLLDKQGLCHQRISAIDGANLQDHTNSDNREMGRDLTLGEIGCYLSHLKAAQAFLDTGAHMGVVFEDDLQATKTSFDNLETTLKDLEEIPADSWDLVNIGRPPRHEMTPVEDVKHSNLFHAHYFPVTTAALIWSRTGAQAFVKMLSNDINLPVDLALQGWLSRSGRGLACQSALFTQREGESQLDSVQPRRRQARDWNYQIKRLVRQSVNRRFAKRHQKALKKQR